MVKMQSLDGEWTLCRLKTGEILPARVPGSVYSDLLRAEKMEDPFWRDNELQATRIMDEVNCPVWMARMASIWI